MISHVYKTTNPSVAILYIFLTETRSIHSCLQFSMRMMRQKAKISPLPLIWVNIHPKRSIKQRPSEELESKHSVGIITTRMPKVYVMPLGYVSRETFEKTGPATT